MVVGLSTALTANWLNLSPKAKLVLGATLLWAAVLAAAGVAAGPHLLAYLTLFGLSILANALLFIPSGRVPLLVGSALVLNPLAVCVVGGAGGAIGELAGYFLGRSSRRVLKNDKMPKWLQQCARRYLPLTILLTSGIPNPFADAVSIFAGRLCYPVWKYLALTVAGKVVQAMVIVHLALWNFSLIREWLG